MSNEDDGTRIGLGLVLAVVTLLLLALLAGLAQRTLHRQASAAAAQALAGPVDAPAGELISRVTFGPGQSALPPTAEGPLTSALDAIQANAGKWLRLSGGHEASGSPAQNTELARQRTQAVREALLARGVPADRVLLAPPSPMSADASAAAPADTARRVEIRLLAP